MKKPQYKDTPVASVCQAFYRQYMLSNISMLAKKCYTTQNSIYYNQNLLILTMIRSLL